MANNNFAKEVERLNLLDRPHVPRSELFEILKFQPATDLEICNSVERIVEAAVVAGDGEIQLDTELALLVVSLMKDGAKRSRGGQPSTRCEQRRRSTLVMQGHNHKAGLVKGGCDATQAHLEAAEKAAAQAKRLGFKFSASYIAREMDKA